jgi:hypothetical protein
MPQHTTVRARLPRDICRMIAYPKCDAYRREQYQDAAESKARLNALRDAGVASAVRYSDTGAVGLVYVVAWLAGEGGDMAPANREGRGDHLHNGPSAILEKTDLDTVSMETPTSPWPHTEIGENSGFGSVSIETPNLENLESQLVSRETT